ncbi:MAG: hypothetical protein VKQ33_11470 [Candidatus Sericytochromatia bacterium]|nr:hypothetical protein [Candidatus Sericytochromatia bacterium]
MRLAGPALSSVLLLVACSQPPATPPAAAPAAPAVAASQPPVQVAGRVQVVGQLRIPAGLALAASARLVGERAAGLVSNNAGALVANPAGGLAAPGAGALLAGPRRRLQQLPTSGVEGARIYLADQSGSPIPGLPEGRTDQGAAFTLEQVPAEEVFVIVAEVPTATGKLANFRTIVQVGKYGATTVIDPPSTLVAYHVLDGLPAGSLGNFNPAKFKTAAEATSRSLTAENLPDFTDVLAIKASMARIVELVEELRDILLDVRQDLAEIKSSLEALRTSPVPGGLPSVSPSAAPVSPAAPTPAGPSPTPPTAPAAGGGASVAPSSLPASLAPSAAASSAPSVAPSVTPSLAPSLAPSVTPSVAAGCEGERTPHKFAVGNPGIQRIGVALLDTRAMFPDQGAIFASGTVSGGTVTLTVPEACPLQFFIDVGGGWMPERTASIPAGSGNQVLPF